MSYSSEYQNLQSVQGLGDDDDDDWGSDFDEFQTELCSQEIQDNLINESREANLLKQANKVSINNFQHTITLPIDESQSSRIIAGNPTIEARKTGAIPKLGFSYLTNTNISENSRTNVSNLGNDISQNSSCFSSNNQNFKILHQSQNSSIAQASNSKNMLSRCSNDETQQVHQQPIGISTKEAPVNKTPRKLKPEAFSFLSKISSTSNDLNIPKENNTNTSKEKKHLVPTAFVHAERLRNFLSLDGTVTITQPNLHESINVAPNESPLENLSNSYEPIGEEIISKSVTRETEKPPLPSRPPPVLKYPPGTFSNSRSTSLESTVQSTALQSSPQSVSARAKFVHSNSSPVSSNLEDANIITTKSNAVTKNILSLPKKNAMTVAIPPDVLSRPLPPLPVPDREITENTVIRSKMTQCENAKSLKSDNKSIESLIAKASAPYEIPIAKAGASLPRPVTIPSNYLTDDLNCNEIIDEDLSNKEVTEQEQSILTPQQRLAQIIVNQSNVSSEVILSQSKITSAIAARSQNNTFQARPKPKVEKPNEIPDFRSDDRNNISNIPRSRRSLESSVKTPKEEKLEQKQVNSEVGESANSRCFTDQETLLNTMSRPMLPQKAIPMQRSVSCNSLVQTIKDLGFSVWNKPEKNKRNSDGLYLPKKSAKNTSPLSSGKAISPPKAITLISFTPTEDVQHGKNDTSSTNAKRDLFQYPWYHDVNSKEASNRLLSVGENGAYLVRPSTVITDEIKNTLCVLYDWKIRNMYIRQKDDGLYSLGSKKMFEKTFSSIPNLIEHHQKEPIEIKPFGGSASNQPIIYVLLRKTPPKSTRIFA